MSDFLHWLYEHYIKPQINANMEREHDISMESVISALDPGYKEELDRLLKYTSVKAFLLGMRTGEGFAKER